MDYTECGVQQQQQQQQYRGHSGVEWILFRGPSKVEGGVRERRSCLTLDLEIDFRVQPRAGKWAHIRTRTACGNTKVSKDSKYTHVPLIRFVCLGL